MRPRGPGYGASADSVRQVRQRPQRPASRATRLPTASSTGRITMDPNSAEEQPQRPDPGQPARRGPHVPADAEFAANANLSAEAYERAAADPQGWWAEQARRLTWATAVHRGARLLEAAARHLVRRRQVERRLQLRRPARRGRLRRQGGDPLGGRAGRQPHHHLRAAQGRGLQGRRTRCSNSVCRPATGWPSTCR